VLERLQGLVAGSPGRQKDDRGRQRLLAQDRDEVNRMD